MNPVVVLDTGPLGFLINPNHHPTPVAIRRWMATLLLAGRRIILLEIADYEVRRELIRRGSRNALAALDRLAFSLEYLVLTTPVMRLAAELWAQARNTGQQTSHDHALDGDVILAAQARSLGTAVVVATDNPTHLSRFVPSESWTNIAP